MFSDSDRNTKRSFELGKQTCKFSVNSLEVEKFQNNIT